MKLHTYFRSSASFRVRIALALKGVPCDSAFVSLVKGEHATDAFRAVNPQALVPALEDGGRTLIQSLAIMEYLEERHPQPPLLPRDPLDRAYVRAVCGIVACEIHPLNNLRTLKHIRRTYGLDEAGVNAWYRHWIADGLGMLERYLVAEDRAGRCAFGDAPTMADCCIVPQIFNARRYDCDLAPYPRVMRVFDACMQLEPFIAAQPSQQPDATA
jgi:maleylacetoacetate isomerase/maleylpyruvate isomerase